MGMRIVKAFGMEEREIRRFSEQCRLFFGRSMRVVSAQAAMSPVTELLSAVGVVVAFGYAAVVHMPFEDFLTFALALVVLYDPVKKLSRLHLGIQQSSASADRIFEILDQRATVEERPDALAFAEPIERIEFRNVGFSYGNGPVLTGISLVVNAGERVALVGTSGGGKTSLVSLLPRFFDPTEGQVLINGRDIRDLSLHSLRRQFGLVTQDTILFNDTVAGNIAYGDPAASAEAIRDAAVRAHAHDFIMKMPEGYDTMIGERGVRLSGGQRQRLAIARALLCNPPALILDEATSALDTESERQVQEALGEAMQGRTVFAIAHRLSTIAHCERILVLSEGRVAEQGTHQELLALGGIYKRLYDLQFKT
jgi:subfamily B ATP-binding cassette protein MsbA